MLSKANTLKGYKLNSLDGEIGKVKEFYFDDQHWAIRSLFSVMPEALRLPDLDKAFPPQSTSA